MNKGTKCIKMRGFRWGLQLFFCLLYASLPAQDFDDYQPLTSRNPLPEQVFTRSSLRYQSQLEDLASDQDDKVERQGKEKFLLQSNYLVDELFQSGKVLFNDPVGSYINQIKDYLLRDLPELKEKVRVFLVRSSAVNAFCTNDGTVLVNIGLVAKAKNEAQLAFILCHEFQHFIKRHPLNRAVEREKIKKNSDRILGGGDKVGIMVATNRYSRDQETEADRLGLDLYLKSSYSPQAAVETFELLRLARLPFGNGPWDANYMESAFLRIPDRLRLDSIQEIRGEESYSEEFSSHPSLDSRTEIARSRLADLSEQGGDRYVIGESDFQKMQKTCRFETVQLLVEEGGYEKALYQIFLLSQDNPNSRYLEKLKVECLYEIARVKNNRRFFDIHIDYEDVEGESQAVYYLFEEIERDEMNILALDHAWRYFKKYPGLVSEEMVTRLGNDMIKYHEKTLEGMSREEPGTENTASDNLEGLDPEGDVDPEALTTPDAFKFAFAEYYEDPAFTDMWDDLHKKRREEKPEEFLTRQEYRKAKNGEKKKGYQLGLDKVVFFSPFFRKMDERKDISVAYVSSENTHKKFREIISNSAEKLDLDYEMLDMAELNAQQTDRFNHILLLRKLVSQVLNEEAISLSALDKKRLKALSREYGTPYFAFTGGMVVTTRKNRFKSALAMCSGVYLVTLPFVIYYLLKPETGTLYVNYLFNVETGKVVMKELEVQKTLGGLAELKSRIYYSVMQMKAK